MPRLQRLLLGIVCGGALPWTASAGPLDALWAAPNTPAARELAVERILAREPELAVLRRELAQGRPYSAEVPTGFVTGAWTSSTGRIHRWFAFVPEDYDPQRSYPLNVLLHGNVTASKHGAAPQWWPHWEPFVGDGCITLFPEGWGESPWWEASQIEGLAAIARQLRRQYNIDENRQILGGLSDGGSGTLYHAFQASTPWAGFLPIIGHPTVLYSEVVGAEGQMYAVNLSNKPLFFVNGEDDELYPASSLVPWIDLFRRAGASLEFVTQSGGHNVRWWPAMSARFAEYFAARPRSAHPEHLLWESEDPVRSGRCHWVRIDALGRGPSDHAFQAYNSLVLPESGQLAGTRAFPHPRASGRIEVWREGNTVRALTRGVARFTLLLDSTLFDQDAPLRLELNGRLWQEHRVRPDAGVLLRWWLADEDRTMLYDVELVIETDAAP